MRKKHLAAMALAALAGMGLPALPSTFNVQETPIRSKRTRRLAKDPLATERQAHNEAVEQRKRDRLAARQAKRMAV